MAASRGQWLMVGGIVAAIGAALLVAYAVTPDVDLVAPGVKAPNVVVSDVVTGDSVPLTSTKGQVVFLNIWATWCGPCQAEMPSIQALHDSLAHSGLKILAVSVDDGSNQQVEQWVAQRHFTFRILHDPTGNIERTYQTTGVPESFVINRQGVIVKRAIGAERWNDPANIALFRHLLAEN
ncbi:MAG TPA: TlpA disulfide reductase family protein [Gemmatimonadales bacterium]|nr:TlpA disulfide reductase family protein [Gemmatimonadales bacterium]